MLSIISQLIGIIGPLILKIIEDHRNDTGKTPTAEEMRARFDAHKDQYLNEGAAWWREHGRS